jgi:beta-galactosidase
MANAQPGLAGPSRNISFDADWRFHQGDAPGAESPALDISGWRAITVPHDWSIEGPAGRNRAAMEGPFDPQSLAKCDGGYLNGGIGWYRKTFALPETASSNRVFLEFDGVYMDSDVWINGRRLGNHPYGYTGFHHDLTPFVNFGADNVVAVRVKAMQPCSRWYSGAGIFRHVWLRLASSAHIPQWGTYVTTPEISGRYATVRVRTRICNDGKKSAMVQLTTVLQNPQSKTIARDTAAHRVAAGADYEFDQTLKVSDVQRWSLEKPKRYRAVSTAEVEGKATDVRVAPFGIRTIRFTADRGFFLNEQHVVIHGVCDHHDLGCLGSAVSRRGIERQLDILKAMGCNAIRTSHNPPAPELLDLCDQMGFLVMDEAFDEWKTKKTPLGYGRFFDAWSERDLVSMLHRDRNHPSIVLWSIGNEIPEQDAAKGFEMSKRLADICRREDPTRPVTSACNSPDGAVRTGYAKPLDVFGVNYNIGAYRKHRGKVLVASETASALSTRGEYNLVVGNGGKLEIKPQRNHQCTSYDLCNPAWGCTAETSLMALAQAPWVAGEFVWTGFDYIGEPTPYAWPSRSSYFGIVDLCGFPKDRYYLYQSQWTDKPMVHLLPHWNWKGFEGKEIPVWCFTNGDSVELFLNGKSLGEKTAKDRKNLHFEWNVPYKPGKLKAIARRNGKTVATAEVRTAGKPMQLLLAADRKRIAGDGQDVAFVEFRVVDQAGQLCPDAGNLVKLVIRGPGKIAGVENGDPTDHEPFQGQQLRVFHGLGLVVIGALHQTGEIHLDAAAESLPTATASVSVRQ